MQTDLTHIRGSVSKILTLYMWLNVPAIAATGLLNHTSWVPSLIAGALIAAVATAAWRASPTGTSTRFVMAVAIVLDTSLLVYVAHGPWQIDFHMIYFAALALLVSYACWQTILVAAAVTAVHHLGLNFIYPYAVFPDGASFFRVVLHAVIVVIETGVLVWLSIRLVSLIETSADALAAVAQEEKGAQAARAEAEAAHARAEQQSARLQDLIATFEHRAGGIASAVGAAGQRMRSSAEAMIGTANDTSGRASSVASSAESATSSVNAVASAAEELSASIAEIRNQVERSADMSRGAVDRTDRSRAAVEGLAQSTRKITEVVDLITDIAEQTNLLALNATIEAARAGEAGKGFAVVANEVKALANQTARATDEISAQIGAVQSEAESAVTAIGDITEAVHGINQVADSIAQAIDQQNAATREIAQNVQQAASGTGEVSGTIAGVSEAARQAETAANDVLGAADGLTQQAEALSDEVEDFLSQVRATA
jgi:methyl-accepting chemotaxis protein